jgi:hypothetical protein
MSEEELDTETLVFKQIDRVLRTASLDLDTYSKGDSRPRKDTDTWSHRVLLSTMFFDSFLNPIKSEEEQKEINEARQNASGPDYAGQDFERFFKAKAIFEENVKILHKNNMVFQESDEMVIDDKEDLLESGSSDVDEEVVE